jgi:hypothetical protein
MAEIIKGDIWYITRNAMERTKCAQSNAEKGIKSYIVDAGEGGLIIGASTIDLPVRQIIDIYGKENVSILSGHPPTPPHCPPVGCPTTD